MGTFRKFYGIAVPAVNIAMPDWLGASYVIAQYNYTADQDFVLRDFWGYPYSSTCVVVIRWRKGFNVHRYKLWEGVGEFMPTVDLYQGEVIKKNFSIEIWSVESSADSVELDSYDIETSASMMRSSNNCGDNVIEYTDNTSTAWLSNP